MKRFKTIQAISEYYRDIGGEVKQINNQISVWNGINVQYDFYEFMGGFWTLL